MYIYVCVCVWHMKRRKYVLRNTCNLQVCLVLIFWGDPPPCIYMFNP